MAIKVIEGSESGQSVTGLEVQFHLPGAELRQLVVDIEGQEDLPPEHRFVADEEFESWVVDRYATFLVNFMDRCEASGMDPQHAMSDFAPFAGLVRAEGSFEEATTSMAYVAQGVETVDGVVHFIDGSLVQDPEEISSLLDSVNRFVTSEAYRSAADHSRSERADVSPEPAIDRTSSTKRVRKTDRVVGQRAASRGKDGLDRGQGKSIADRM